MWQFSIVDGIGLGGFASLGNSAVVHDALQVYERQ
jgi:hypothetical protein